MTHACIIVARYCFQTEINIIFNANRVKLFTTSLIILHSKSKYFMLHDIWKNTHCLWLFITFIYTSLLSFEHLQNWKLKMCRLFTLQSNTVSVKMSNILHILCHLAVIIAYTLDMQLQQKLTINIQKLFSLGILDTYIVKKGA